MGDTEARNNPLRLIAFYLPQYHPIPENDRWWGRGFTEWTNVTKANPAFGGHYQPHVPGELGYYDLRVPEVRDHQARLAREYGIYGFCYYHYWFQGKRLLERPFNEVLESRRPDFPFCLCWANEAWTRRWDGREGEVLMQQQYSPEDDRRHMAALIPAFDDPRYIRIDGKPVFLVYQTRHLPDAAATSAIWREEARRRGVGELYLIKVDNPADEGVHPDLHGFDAAVEFQPAWHFLRSPKRSAFLRRVAARLGLTVDVYRQHRVYRYEEVIGWMLARPRPNYLRFPCVMPMWDNTARRAKHAVIFDGSTPALYERWLRAAVAAFTPPTPDENLLFINAWNEWGEGNHLEPDQKWGRAYLEATRQATAAVAVTSTESAVSVPRGPVALTKTSSGRRLHE